MTKRIQFRLLYKSLVFICLTILVLVAPKKASAQHCEYKITNYAENGASSFSFAVTYSDININSLEFFVGGSGVVNEIIPPDLGWPWQFIYSGDNWEKYTTPGYIVANESYLGASFINSGPGSFLKSDGTEIYTVKGVGMSTSNIYVNNSYMCIYDGFLVEPPVPPNPIPNPGTLNDRIWSPEKRFTPEYQSPGSSSIALDDEGNTYIVYSAYDPHYYRYHVFFSYKPKGGSWTSTQLLRDDIGRQDQLYPDLFVDKFGGAHAAWTDYRDTVCNIYYSYRPAGGDWQPNERVSDTSPSNCSYSQPSITVDSDQKVYVAWTKTDYDKTIYYSSKFPGENWSTNKTISNASNSPRDPNITVDSSGNVYAVWSENSNPPYYRYIFYSYKPLNGEWTPKENIIDQGGLGKFHGQPTIALDPQGNIFVVWGDGREYIGSNIYFSYKSAGGAWSANERVNDSYTKLGEYASLPKLSIDKSGNAYVVWQDFRYDNIFTNSTIYNVYSSYRPSGGSWQPSVRVNDVYAEYPWIDRFDPDIATNNSGEVYAVWHSAYATAPQNHFFYYSVLQSADQLPPTSSLIITGVEGLGGWYKTFVDGKITAIDNDGGSGIKEIHYVLNGVETVISGSNASPTLSSEGINSLVYWSVDNAGNIEGQKSTEIKIDTSTPIFTVTSPVGTISELSPTLNFAVSDSVSGVSSYQVLFNGVDVTQNTQLNLTYLTAGNYNLSLSATDNAGNITNTTSIFMYSPNTETIRQLFDKMYAEGEITKLGTSLYDKLTQAEGYINSGNYTGATATLNALKNQIIAQIDIHVTAYSGSILIQDINYLIRTTPTP